MAVRSESHQRRARLRAVVGALLLAPAWAQAAPWAQTGDVQLRHDLQRLADAGVIAGTMSTWPVPWQSVAEALSVNPAGADTPALRAAAARVRQAAIRAQVNDGTHARVKAGGADEPSTLRGYADQPRSAAEGQVWLENRSGAFAGRVAVTGVDDAPDDEEIRYDDSYGAFQLGNWWVGVGAVDRWWGPGNDGSLILSNNARPVPAVMLERAGAQPFESKWLSWLGPWRLSTFLGQLEDDRFIPNTKFFGMRLVFRPMESLTFGLSRSALFGGDRGRPEDLETFGRMLVGDDNQGATELDSEEPGDQIAGWDVRWAPDWFGVDPAFYVQRIGEDFSDGIVTRQMSLLGTELAGGWGRGSWRVYLEYADTRSAGTDFLDATIEQRNISYQHGIYRDGYTYEGRVMGHSIDGDSTLWSLGGVYITGGGHTIDWVLRTGELNDDGRGRSSVAPTGARIDSFRVGYHLPWRDYDVGLRLGGDRVADLDGTNAVRDGFAAVTLGVRF